MAAILPPGGWRLWEWGQRRERRRRETRSWWTHQVPGSNVLKCLPLDFSFTNSPHQQCDYTDILFLSLNNLNGAFYPGEGNGNPLQYSRLENSMDWGAWWATVHRVTKRRTRLSDFSSSRSSSGSGAFYSLQPTPFSEWYQSSTWVILTLFWLYKLYSI